MVRICLVKADKTPGSCWLSLLTDQFAADPFVADQMQQKLTLQRFQLEVSLCSFLGPLPQVRSRPNTAGLYVCPNVCPYVRPYIRTYVRPSTKSFSNLNEIWYVDRGR